VLIPAPEIRRKMGTELRELIYLSLQAPSQNPRRGFFVPFSQSRRKNDKNKELFPGNWPGAIGRGLR
jgi:hypothetical protein